MFYMSDRKRLILEIIYAKKNVNNKPTENIVKTIEVYAKKYDQTNKIDIV